MPSTVESKSALPTQNDDVVIVPDREVEKDHQTVLYTPYTLPPNISLPGPPSLVGQTVSKTTTTTTTTTTPNNVGDDDDCGENKYPRDSYSFLALNNPGENFVFFSFGLMAFVFQFAFLTLMILSVVGKDLQTGDIGDGVDNPGNPGSSQNLRWASGFFPSNTSNLARATQITSLLSFMVFADETLMDIVKALELIPPLWSSSKTRNSSKPQNNERLCSLMVSCVLRYVQGIMAVFAVFLLVMTESSVIDIVLNFTAVNFISALDDTAFALARWGKFGPNLKREAKRIEQTDLPPSVSSKRIQAWYTAAVLPTSVMLLCLMCGIMVYQERNDKWITRTFRVQFQDSTGFESYSGCFHLDPDQKIHKRYIYTSDGNNTERSKFGYCLERRQWMFFVDNNDNNDEIDPCSAVQNELAHSSRATSFDVSTSFGADWFSYFNTPLEMYFIEEDSEDALMENCGSFVNDGICDDAFNNFFYQHDGGDCCAATCMGPQCGKPKSTFGDLGPLIDNPNNNDNDNDNNGEINFENCRDPNMIPLVIKMGVIEEKDHRDRTWWANTVSSMPGREDYWKPRILIECDGYVVLASSELEFMGGEEITTKIEPSAERCTITTEHFDLVWNASYTVTSEGATKLEEKTKNPIPNKIGNLTLDTKFDRIDLSGNDFTGTIPSEIGMNWNLTSLILDHNYLTGNIPMELAKLEYLNELSLSGNSLTGTFPWEILLLSRLTKLNFDNNGLTGTIPTEIALLTTLTHLSLYNNSFHGYLPSAIKALTNLKSLNLGRNNFFGSVPSEIESLTNLESLYLDQNDFTGAVPDGIESLTKLKELDLGQNSFNTTLSVDFSPLTNIELLDLGDNSFTSSFPTSILSLTKLTHLDLGQNFFVGEFFGNLVESLMELKYLNLHKNDVRGDIPRSIGDLKDLEHLDLDDIGLNGTIPVEIANLRKLTHLDLDGNELTGLIPTEIGRLTNLLALDIGQNFLSGSIPSELGLLTELRGLWLYFNLLEGKIPCELEALSKLSEINLNFNDLSGLIPKELRADVIHISSQSDGLLVYASADCQSS